MYNSKELVVDPELTFLSYNQTINAEFTVEEILESYLWITDYTPIFEDIGVTGNKNNYWVNQGSAWSVSTDSTGTTLTEQNPGNYTPSNIVNSTNWNDHLTFDLGYYVEFDVVNVNRAMFRVYYRGDSKTFFLKTGHYKFFVDEGVIRYWFDGVEQRKIDNPNIQGSLIFSFVASNDRVTSSLKYKNFKIYKKSRIIKAIPLFNCDSIVSSNEADMILDMNKCIILQNDENTIIRCMSKDMGKIHYYDVQLFAYAIYSKLDVIDDLDVFCIVYDKYLNTLDDIDVEVYIDEVMTDIVKTDTNGVCRFKVDQPCTVRFVYGELESNDVVVRSHDYSLSISVDKESLSTDESVTITGVLTVDGEVYADQSIDLYDGVSLVDTLTTDSNGEYTKTFTGLSAGTHVFRAVHTNVQSSTVRVVVHDYSLTVTGDNLIQSGDVDSIIATLKDNGVVVSGETLSYQIKHGSTTIDTGTDTTDNNGQISITYTGTGIGDVDVIVSYSNIQETYELYDCILTELTSATYELTTATTSQTLIKAYNINGSQYVFTIPVVYEFDVESVTNPTGMRLRIMEQDTTPIYLSTNLQSIGIIGACHVKCIMDNNGAKWYVDDVQKYTSNDVAVDPLGIAFIVLANNTASITVKNAKIYSI